MFLVNAQVHAEAKKEHIAEKANGRLVVFVKEPARRNLANMRVRTLLAAYYKVPAQCVRLSAGHRSPRKVFEISDPEHV